jgi:hypothetical protein
MTGSAFELVERLKRAVTPVDLSGDALTALEEARDALLDAYNALWILRQAAVGDPQPSPEDRVVEASDELLDAAAAAHHAMNDLCWALGEHDADFDKPLDGVYTSADELITALKG